MRAWIVVLALFAAHPALARTVSYAVVIGNNDRPGDTTTLGRLRYADDDAVPLIARLADRMRRSRSACKACGEQQPDPRLLRTCARNRRRR